MTSRHDRCAYCAMTTLTGDEKPEHPIPQALGSSLAVYTVCVACNSWAGREIDQPFIGDDFLQMYRSAARQRDERRKSAKFVPSPLLQGRTPEGDRITWDPVTQRPVMGSQIVDLGGGSRQIRASSEDEAARLLKREGERAAKDGKQLTVDRVERGQMQPTINVALEIDTGLWRRMAAKIGLAVGSIVYPVDWRVSADAKQLREWMNNRDASTADGTAPGLVPRAPPAEAPLARADEHVVFFTPVASGTCLVVILYGAAWFAVPVESTGAPIPQQAWRLDWRKPRRNGATTLDDLVEDAAARLGGASPSAR